MVDSFFATSYILDNQYIKIKTDKSDLLLRIVDNDTLIGEGFAKGTYIKNGKPVTNIQKIDTKNQKKYQESNEKMFIQQELTDQLKRVQDFILNNPERIREVYFGEEDFLTEVKRSLLIKSTGVLIIKKNNQYHRNEKIGDVYLYTEEGRKGSDEKMKVEYQFRKNNSAWIIQEFRFITTDMELD